ncbi:MAG: hypothetical protein ACKOJ9_00250 [Actinomycetota bacterium]
MRGLLALFPLMLVAPAPTDASVGCLLPPVTGPVIAPYVEPPCPYCAGHRTIDFASRLGDAVVSPVAGVVTFYGFVAGTLYITIDPNDATGFRPGERVTVGGMILDDVAAEGPNPRPGDPVRRGERVGDAAPGSVSLSLRTSDGTYLDPTRHLGRWRSQARLLPRSGPGRPNLRVLTCPAATPSR